jgi:hypothetical protein
MSGPRQWCARIGDWGTRWIGDQPFHTRPFLGLWDLITLKAGGGMGGLREARRPPGGLGGARGGELPGRVWG